MILKENPNNYSFSKILDSVDIDDDFNKYEFYSFESKYFTYETRNKKTISIQLSNFIGKSLFNLVNETNNSKRIIQIQRDSGEIYLIEIQSSDMKPDSFETILKSKRCTFFGNAQILKRIFHKWMDEELQAKIINTLGWNPSNNIYAFSNAVYDFQSKELLEIDSIGIINDEKTGEKYFLPAFSQSNINDLDYEKDRKFRFIKGEIGFNEWAKIYYKAYGLNGAIAIQYLIMSLFWDIIFEQIGFFPFLFLFGAYGTGKTSLVESLLKVFGMDYIGISLNNASQVGLSRSIASRNNTIFYLKEYTSDTDDSNQDLLLTAYDGSGRTTGIKSNDNRTQIAAVKSAIILDGNNLPVQKSAVLSRMILMNFDNNTFSTEQTENWNKLKEIENEGLGKVIIDILSHREIFLKEFKSKFDLNKRELKESGKANFDDRTLQHVALILTPSSLLWEKLEFPFEFKNLVIDVINNARDQSELLRQTNETTIFWESFSYNIQKGILIEFKKELYNKKESHFNIKRISGNPCNENILQIKYSIIYPEYVKYCKNNNLKFIDKNSLKRLLTSESYKHFINGCQKDRGGSYTDKYFGSCYQFNLVTKDNDLFIDEIEIIT